MYMLREDITSIYDINDLCLGLQIVNSIVMNHVTIEDGCSIQGSVVCSNVQLQERVVLKDCQVHYFFFLLCFSNLLFVNEKKKDYYKDLFLNTLQ